MAPFFFHELMDGIKKRGDFLDLIDDDRSGRSLSSNQVKQCFRAGSVASENIGLKKIDNQRIRESKRYPRGFARSPGSKEKKAVLTLSQNSTYYFHFETQYGNIVPNF
jgi:hypothetical protein